MDILCGKNALCTCELTVEDFQNLAPMSKGRQLCSEGLGLMKAYDFRYMADRKKIRINDQTYDHMLRKYVAGFSHI